MSRNKMRQKSLKDKIGTFNFLELVLLKFGAQEERVRRDYQSDRAESHRYQTFHGEAESPRIQRTVGSLPVRTPSSNHGDEQQAGIDQYREYTN